MPRFFLSTNAGIGEPITLTGDDAHHISRSLRMAEGERITVCDLAGNDLECVLTGFSSDETVTARVLSRTPCKTEPPYRAMLYQGLPKGEKLDTVIQKAVECGVWSVTPFESERCIVRIRDGENEKKRQRRNRISLEAAKQSGRGIVPQVLPSVPFREALAQASKADLPLFCYEGEGTVPLSRALRSFAEKKIGASCPVISLMIGSEGGFSEAEAAEAVRAGMIPVGLGPRILRTETAAVFVLSCLVGALELDS